MYFQNQLCDIINSVMLLTGFYTMGVMVIGSVMREAPTIIKMLVIVHRRHGTKMHLTVLIASCS